MDLEGSATLRAEPAVVFDHVADLGTYPAWLGIVFGAEPDPPHPADPGPAWMVDLGAKIGPLPITKRVRMVRTEHLPPKQARFERLEHDSQSHSAWVLLVEVEGTGSGASLSIRLHYSGASRLPGIDAILRDEIGKAGDRLQGRLDAPAPG